MTSTKPDKIHNLTIIFLFLFVTILIGYRPFKKLMGDYANHYYLYHPSHPLVSVVNTNHLSPAQGVPVLLFHGVVKTYDNENTTVDNFIADMEMLKANGYQTISVEDLDNFMLGKFTLPPKPIVITFDDGRKDSYYPTDDILQKMGFKATMFLATEKMLDKSTFYLGWDELRYMLSTGRWDIEAHGRDSHLRIPIDAKGTEGRYLTSEMYRPGLGLETEAEYLKRVEEDYTNGINDIRQNLGVNPQYFAVPLNDYGNKTVSNYPKAQQFNESLAKKYFRLAFVESLVGEVDPSHPVVYNFPNTPRSQMVRIEPRNMPASVLKQVLEIDAPKPINLVMTGSLPQSFNDNIALQYGAVQSKSDGLSLSTTTDNSAKVTFGQIYWDNYQVDAKMKLNTGNSVSLMFYATDSDNYLLYGISEGSLFLRQTLNGKTFDLVPPILPSAPAGSLNDYRLVINHQKVDAYFNDRLIFKQIPVNLARGYLGFRTWGDTRAQSTLNSLVVAPQSSKI